LLPATKSSKLPKNAGPGVVHHQGCHVCLFKAKFRKSGLISSWLALENSFRLLALFWPFYAEKFSSEGKYYYSIFSATHLQNFAINDVLARRLRSGVGEV